jgi:hypothetical protein
VTVHRVALRAGVVTAMAVALLAGLLTAPVHAQQPDLRLGGISNIELRVGGGAQNVTIQVENRSPTDAATDVRVTMTVPLTEFGVHIPSAPGECSRSNSDTFMECNLGEIPPRQSRSVVAQVGVHGNSNLQAGETRNGNAQVTLSSGGQTSFNVRLQGPDRPQGVAEVSGVVTDQTTGKGIDGATVFLTDSQDRDFERTTNAEGRFQFQGEEIAAGSIGLRASKDGYESNSTTENVQPGQSLTGVQLSLRNTAPPTSEPPPTSAPPPTTGGPTVAPPLEETSSGGGTFTTIMIILGILFVLLGIGAIVMLIIRRRREKDEDEGPEGADDPTSGPRGPTPTPGSHGVYRPTPTQVMGPRGPLPAVGPQPALANAPTMMQPRAGAADETALLPRAGDAPTRAMGPRPPVPGSPPPPRSAAPTYGAAAATQAFDDPRGRHSGPPPDRYDDPTQAGQPYGSPAARQGPGYGSPPPRGSAEYGSQGHGAQGYGSPTGRHERGGYGSSYESGSYGPDPYTQPQPAQPPYEQGGHRGSGHGGYDRSADYRGSGYPDAGQGYDQSGHRPDPAAQQGYPSDYSDESSAPRSRHAEPPERRRLDWLDD